MKVRISKHKGVSPRAGKLEKGSLLTSVRDYMLICDYHVACEDFRILGSESNKLIWVKRKLVSQKG